MPPREDGQQIIHQPVFGPGRPGRHSGRGTDLFSIQSKIHARYLMASVTSFHLNKPQYEHSITAPGAYIGRTGSTRPYAHDEIKRDSESAMDGLISVAQAQALIEQHTLFSGTETVPLALASGRVLATTLRAERDQPPYDRVMMDGIAIRASDARTFETLGTQQAGMPPLTLAGESSCLAAMTGAVLPVGADTVIPIERLVATENGYRLEDGYDFAVGQFVHRRGADCHMSDVLLEPGLKLNAPALAVLASNGAAHVEVARLPSIAIISTGDELVPVEGPVRAWEIRRSNEHAIAGALAAKGLTRNERLWVGDDMDATVATLERALATHDVLILSGGVSMGAFDHVPAALARLGVTRVFHKIAQRPGKPMWFGTDAQGRRVFALPGNPVSALTCCVRYVVPSLLASLGVSPYASGLTPAVVRLDAPADRVPTLARFVPVRVRHDASGVMRATPAPVPTSGDFSHLATTDGFVELLPGRGPAETDTAVPFHGW